jgi:hypothetical protein
MREKRNAYRLFVRKPEGKRAIGRPLHRWVNNVNMELGDTEWGVRTGLVWSQTRISGEIL